MILYCMGTSCQLGAASGMLSLHAGYWEGGFLSSGLLSFPWASIIPPRAFLSNARGAFGEGGNPSLDLSFPHPVSFPPEPFCSRRGVLWAKAGIHVSVSGGDVPRRVELPADPISKAPQASLVRLCLRGLC